MSSRTKSFTFRKLFGGGNTIDDDEGDAEVIDEPPIILGRLVSTEGDHFDVICSGDCVRGEVKGRA